MSFHRPRYISGLYNSRAAPPKGRSADAGLSWAWRPDRDRKAREEQVRKKQKEKSNG